MASNLKNLIARYILLFLFFPSILSAHELKPSIANLTFKLEKEIASANLEIQTNLEAIIANIDPTHANTDQSANANYYNELRSYSPIKLEKIFREKLTSLEKKIHLLGPKDENFTLDKVLISEVGDIALARNSKLIFKATNLQSKTYKFSWDKELGPIILRVTTAKGEDGYTKYILTGDTSETFSIEKNSNQSFLQTVLNYIALGFEHIVPKGLDHILFVVGLFLLSPKFKPLLLQVTSFTIAHTVTLFLGILNIIHISPNIVEPIIALSITYVAIENIFFSKLSLWRPALVFLFGLLHGLGFAGVLNEIGVSASYFVTSLISFNLGVELGQLSVILLCFLVLAIPFQNKLGYKKWITNPLSILIALVSLYWFFERI